MFNWTGKDVIINYGVCSDNLHTKITEKTYTSAINDTNDDWAVICVCKSSN